jgi:hypothetical protein
VARRAQRGREPPPPSAHRPHDCSPLGLIVLSYGNPIDQTAPLPIGLQQERRGV